MRGKVSRVILVCTMIVAFSYGWWPFEKGDDKAGKRRRRGRDQEDEEPDRVEQEWEVEDKPIYEPEKGRGTTRDRKNKQDREKARRDAIRSPTEKSRDYARKKPRNREELEQKETMKDVLDDDSVEENDSF